MNTPITYPAHSGGYRRKEKKMSRENLKKARQEAGMTQQQMADRLGVGLRYYKQIEAGKRTGNFILWDTLEDITGVHQRILREMQDNRPGKEENP